MPGHGAERREQVVLSTFRSLDEALTFRRAMRATPA